MTAHNVYGLLNYSCMDWFSMVTVRNQEFERKWFGSFANNSIASKRFIWE